MRTVGKEKGPSSHEGRTSHKTGVGNCSVLQKLGYPALLLCLSSNQQPVGGQKAGLRAKDFSLRPSMIGSVGVGPTVQNLDLALRLPSISSIARS
jgi:hypothetical protein